MRDSVDIKVVSVNTYGDSPLSTVGSGAVIQLVPDAPINLQNSPTITSDTQIMFSWEEGLSNGGTPVIDYEVYYDQGTNNFILVNDEVQTTEFLIGSLSAGITYT